MPAVSVIVPTYNRAQLIRETLNSIFAQSFLDFECIVVDDGSSDGTGEAIRDLLPQLTYQTITHAGVAAALNAGLALAHGEYVAFLDSDDRWDPCFLERMVHALEAAPWAGFVYCDYTTFNAQGPVRSAWLTRDEKLHGNILARLLASDFIATGTLLIRRECFESVTGFDPVFVVAADWDLWLRLALHFKADCVDEPLTYIRVHSNQLSQNRPAIYRDNLGILRKLQRYYSAEIRPYRSIIRGHFRHFHHALAAYCWQTHQPLKAVYHSANFLMASLI